MARICLIDRADPRYGEHLETLKTEEKAKEKAKKAHSKRRSEKGKKR